jgi:flagellar basal-body rod protein FlgC
MNLFGALEISSSALVAQRQRAEVVTSNLANAETTRTPAGGPYRRQHVIFGARRISSGSFGTVLAATNDLHAQGVQVERVVTDTTPALRRFDPGHPDADAEGYTSYPAINPIEEMVNLMGASQAYQLNVSAVRATKAMILQSIDILR